jgi:phage head maturation protease
MRISRRAASNKTDRAPSSLDKASKSVELIATTDAPVKMWDWDRADFYTEILSMGGLSLPFNAQVPLIDSHDRRTVDNVFGSFSDFRIEDNARLVGRAYFSDAPRAKEAFQKVREGHLTDFSIGYEVLEAQELSAGQKETFSGRTYEGPCRVATKWALKELSICPIGADPAAKARGLKRENEMNISEEELRRRLERADAEDDETGAKSKRKKKGDWDEDEEKAEGDENEEKSEDDETEGKSKRKKKADWDEDEEKSEDDETEGKSKRKKKAEDDEDEEKEDDDESEGKAKRKKKAEGDEDETKGGKRSIERILARERSRVRGVNELCRTYGIDDNYRQIFVDSGASLDAIRGEVLKMRRQEYSGGAPVAWVTRDEVESFRGQVVDGIMARANALVKKPTPGYEQFRQMPLIEIARECLRKKGERNVGWDPDVTMRALTTSDLPHLLVETTKRFLLKGFEEAEETYTKWTSEGTANDFKINQAISFEVDNELMPLMDDEEYQYTQTLEASETYKIGSFGRKIKISRNSIINDDLGALTIVPTQMGQGIQRLIATKVYGVLAENAPMGDGKPLFHADHGNIVTLSGGDPTINTERLSKVLLTLRKQTNAMGRLLNIKEQCLLFPKWLEAANEQFFSSQYIGVQAEPLVNNIYHNMYSRIYDLILDEQDRIADAKTWYLTAGPKDMGVKVFYLQGVKVPYLETVRDLEPDGLVTYVRFDFGVKAMSWRGLYKVVTTA